MLEDWTDESDWSKLSLEIRKEFKNQKLLHPLSSKRYDSVLLIWLRFEMKAVSNEYLQKILKCEKIDGEPVFFEACPCCGRRTIDERGHYDICTVCWWEDNGQDNANSDMISGPNQGLTLTQARYNYLRFGIYNPKRQDLVKIQEDRNKYILGRTFKIFEDEYVIEVGTNWKANIKNTSPKSWLI
jgi:hypothetical protein